MNTSYEYMKIDLEFQKKVVTRLEKEIKKKREKNPEIEKDGHYMALRVNHGRRYYYDAQHCGRKEKLKYLGNGDNPQVVARQELHYLETALSNCNNNIKYLQAAIDNYKPIDPAGVVDSSAKAYQGNYNVGGTIFKQTKADKWVTKGLAEREHYEAERPYPEGLVLRTASGELVRTRGEIIIADKLDSFGLSYVYEWPKWIDGKLRWPDFAVLHPKTQEVITIEYMGRFDDREYREKNSIRLEEFYGAGYILGQNFLIFMDNEQGVIDSSKIHRVLKAFFLD